MWPFEGMEALAWPLWQASLALVGALALVGLVRLLTRHRGQRVRPRAKSSMRCRLGRHYFLPEPAADVWLLGRWLLVCERCDTVKAPRRPLA